MQAPRRISHASLNPLRRCHAVASMRCWREAIMRSLILGALLFPLASCFAPPDSFPGSVSVLDGNLTPVWWGCMALPAGDVREVGSYRDRALLFVPSGACEAEPSISGHLLVTWRPTRPEQDEPFGAIRLVVDGDCPTSITSAARDEAATLIKQFMAASRPPDAYGPDTERALAAVSNLPGPTSPTIAADMGGPEKEVVLFHGGLRWKTMRKEGAYRVCSPIA